MRNNERWRQLYDVAVLFLKLGSFGFGGLPTQIAMMEDEIVRRRQWLSRSAFLDVVGATNLIPGPNSVEVAAHVGYLRARWPGFFVAGCCFIVPSALISIGFAWFYIRFGSLPYVAPLLYGIKPAVIAVVLVAVWRLGSTAVKNWQLAIIGNLVLVAVLLGLSEVIAIVGGGLLGLVGLGWNSRPPQASKNSTPLMVLGSGYGWQSSKLVYSALSVGATSVLAAAVPVSLLAIGLFFLKVGAMLFGSGYVLVAFLNELVRDYGWLTQQQLLDAVAIGQFTPGPFLSTAAFIGYFLAGLPGAAIATIAIFLPSFVFMALLNPIMPRLRRSRWTTAFLDAVNVSSISLMLVATLELSRTALIDWTSWSIMLAAIVIGLRWKLNPSWLVAIGALLGLLVSLV